MRKILLLMHVSLDGFVAGPNGEMDWIKLSDELWDHVETVTDRSDAAVYGEVTFKMMEGYWPTAAEQPDASKHDIDHSRWANAAAKIVFSNSQDHSEWQNTRFVKGDVAEAMAKLRQEPGKDILMLGSPSLAHEFMEAGLIDEYFINVNPVAIGRGKPLFTDTGRRMALELAEAKTFANGVVGLHYRTVR